MDIKISQLEQDGVLLYVIEPSVTESKERKTPLPTVVYFHGIIQEHINKDKDGVSYIKNIRNLPGLESLIENMDEYPFTILVPFCPGYQWPLIFPQIKGIFEAYIKKRNVENEFSIFGLNIGGSWGLHYSQYDRVHSGKVVLINPGSLDNMNIAALVKGDKRYPIIIHHTNGNEYIGASREFRSMAFDEGKYGVIVDIHGAEESDTIKRVIKNTNLFN